MKKLILLLFSAGLFSSHFAAGYLLAGPSRSGKTFITEALADEIKPIELCDRVLGYSNRQPHIDTFNNQVLLAEGCGIAHSSRSVGYDKKRYPHCAQVLAFLEEYSNQLAQLDQKAKELHTVIEANNVKYDNIIEFYVQIFSQADQNSSVEEKIPYKQSPDSFNDAAMDHYIKFAEELKEKGISTSE
ncbi:MAG: hypothetical protein BWY54_00529 [Candidatus Dependentiae bacterium ADurb.Bin331]|nr:MAG: hypothetical protein BWY54_00529 [Candidatus Dependentiae bacterium ADurb.Bin331]